MNIVLAISALFFAWWIVSLRYLPRAFRRNTLWRAKAKWKPGKLVVMAGLVVYLIGFTCNVAVVAANKGKMPVMEFGIYEGGYLPADATKCREEHDRWHTCIHQKTRLKFLADIFVFRSIGYVLSIGDILLCIGTGLMTAQRIWIFLPRRRKKRIN